MADANGFWGEAIRDFAARVKAARTGHAATPLVPAFRVPAKDEIDEAFRAWLLDGEQRAQKGEFATLLGDGAAGEAYAGYAEQAVAGVKSRARSVELQAQWLVEHVAAERGRYHNEDRPHGAIGNKPPITLMNSGDGPSPSP